MKSSFKYAASIAGCLIVSGSAYGQFSRSLPTYEPYRATFPEDINLSSEDIESFPTPSNGGVVAPMYRKAPIYQQTTGTFNRPSGVVQYPYSGYGVPITQPVRQLPIPVQRPLTRGISGTSSGGIRNPYFGYRAPILQPGQRPMIQQQVLTAQPPQYRGQGPQYYNTYNKRVYQQPVVPQPGRYPAAPAIASPYPGTGFPAATPGYQVINGTAPYIPAYPQYGNSPYYLPR